MFKSLGERSGEFSLKFTKAQEPLFAFVDVTNENTFLAGTTRRNLQEGSLSASAVIASFRSKCANELNLFNAFYNNFKASLHKTVKEGIEYYAMKRQLTFQVDSLCIEKTMFERKIECLE